MRRIRLTILVEIAGLLISAIGIYGQTNLIENSGPIGIGTTSPQAPLDIETPTAPQASGLNLTVGPNVSAVGDGAAISFLHSGTERGYRIYESAIATNVGELRFAAGDPAGGYRDDVTFAWNGNVGIGTTNPLERFQIGDTIRFHDGGWKGLTFNAAYSDMMRTVNDGYSAGMFFDTSSGYLRFMVDDTLSAGQPNLLNEVLNLSHTGNVGIGVSYPSARLEIGGDTTNTAGRANIDANGENSVITVDAAGASRVGFVKKYGDSPVIAAGSTCPLRLGHWSTPQLLGNVVSGTFSSDIYIGTSGDVGIGTTSPTNRLEVNGTIRAKEVIVEATNWPDYVFAKDAPQPSLAAWQTSIESDGHLPGMPSKAEAEKDGVSVGEMQKALLEKVEQLSLIVIRQEKRIDDLEAELTKSKPQSGTN